MIIQEQKNRIIPYQMLYEAISGTFGLVEGILLEYGIPSLRLGLKHIKSVLNNFIKKAGEGLPIVGKHFYSNKKRGIFRNDLV